MDNERVILVDENDQPLGSEDKIVAHEKALLHRAFSVFVVRERAGTHEILLQQRAREKYHFGGLWANTCCGHPRAGETVLEAGTRRLREEMGMECELSPADTFIYRAESPNGLFEHELDHVLVGFLDREPVQNLREVAATRWLSLEKLDEQMRDRPEEFAPWLAPALAIARERLAR